MIIEIIFTIVFFSVMAVLLSGAFLIVQDKERQYQERRNQRDNK
jgi:hypothetical protein|tara:strand:+ start:1353 stop:1484 length:132 start_codon:yes stop_codon:yes gene_type:complete